MFMKYPRKFGNVWKKKRVPQVSEKKTKHFELSVKKTKHLKTTWTGYLFIIFKLTSFLRFDFQQKILIHVGAIFKKTLCKIRNILFAVFSPVAVSLRAAMSEFW